MKNTKLKKSIFVALIALLVVCLAVVAGLNLRFYTASAARSVTISGSTIFYTAEDAEVWSHKESDDEFYTMFVLQNDEDAVKYRRNLAFEWEYNANEDTEDDDSTLSIADGYFNMEIGFEAVSDDDASLGFEKYILAFQSQQFTATDDSVTTNYIMFAPTDDNKLSVLVTDDADAAVPESGTEGAITVDPSHIIIQFAASEDKGAYGILITDTASNKIYEAGEFTNIGGTYSKYVSSTTDPVIPITFSAEFGDEEDGAQIAKLVLYEMNGQSFELNSTPTQADDGHYPSGKVNDNAAPVLCLDSNLNYMQIGEEVTFDYTVIDVLASSPSISTSYFMLTNDQAEDENFADALLDASGEYKGRNIYKTVTSSDKQYLIPHSDSYVPTEDDNDIFDGEDLKASALVKIAVKLTDTTASGGLSTYVFLDWYADEDYLVTIKGVDYIAVAEDSVGATYAYVNEDTESNEIDSDAWQEALANYQELVTEAAADLKAGSKNKFYLPDASTLFSDRCTAYEDLSFYIYYNNGSEQSSSNLSYNNLSITLSKSGVYVFTIYVTDADGNSMWYYNEDYQEGVSKEDDKKTEFETSDIWNMYSEEEGTDYEGMKDYLPWFTFKINDSELTIDDPGERDIAYIDTTYSSIDFDINGVEYDETYALYYFRNDDFAEYTGSGSWSDAVLQEAGYEAGDLVTYDILYNNVEYMYKTYREYFKTIVSVDDMADNYSEYEFYRDYAWSTSSLSFVPQEAGYYICTCTVESTGTTPNLPSVTSYMVITSSEAPDSIYGEDTWVQDNVASIVLLCVAGAALIGIVLLIVIRPKEKQDIDEVALVDSAAAKKEKAKAEKKSKKNKK
ncbi:MAG: hypothetical protein LUE27_03915 [Clostridia bacterium]|nr:hypothetical protein [Clostridia bacterium]